MASDQTKNTMSIAGAILFFFILLFIYTKVAGPIPFAVNSVTTQKTNLFQASGIGKVTVIPNTAAISIGVTKTAPTVSQAQDQTNTAVNNILNSIKSLGIDTKDIKTTDYSVNPQYNYNAGSQTITGYSVTQTIQVKIQPIEKANKVVDAATANGANLVNGITFTVDDATLKQKQDEARKLAVNDAKQKAQSLAGAAGMRLGNIVDVQESSDEIAPRPVMMKAAGAANADIQSTQLPAGETNITSNITLSYQTY
jgi:uncharacterized protein YggE